MALRCSLFDEGPPPPCPGVFNLAAHALFADQRADRTALTVVGAGGAVLERWSYAALREAVAHGAGGLRAAGLRTGDRVMLRMGNVADFPILFLAAIAAGGVAVPTSAMLTPPEAAWIARDVGARFVCLGDGFEIDAPGAHVLSGRALADLRFADPLPPARTAADDPAFIVYTS
ncbi:MAG: AMP-binding protein, partial [Rubrimonas sp.]